MIIWTTQGPCLVTEAPGKPDWLEIRSHSYDVIESIAQTLELTDTEEDTDGSSLDYDLRLHYDDMPCIVLSKGSAALWIQHELLNYVDYTSFGKELLKLRGEDDAVMFEKFMMMWETK